MGKRIIVLGGTGFIGRNLVDGINKECEVAVLSRKRTGKKRIASKVQVFYYENYKDFYRIVFEFKPEIAINVSGYFASHNDEDNTGELIDANVTCATYFYDALCKSGCKKVITTTSYWQFDSDARYHPNSLYSATKQAQEDILLHYHLNHSFSCISLVIFDTFGFNDDRPKLINKIRDMKSYELIELSPGNQLMYYVYISDVIEAYKIAINLLDSGEKCIFERFAVRGEDANSLKDIIDALQKVDKREKNIIWGGKPYRDNEIMDPTGWGTVLPGWYPKIELEDGMKLYLKNTSDVEG